MTALMKLGRACLQDIIEAAGDGDEGETTSHKGAPLKRSKEKHRRTYRSIFGPLEIYRFVYAVREKQKVQATPLDEKLGLPRGEISYVLEDWVEGLSANMPYDSAVAWLEKTMGIKIGSTTAENHARKLAEYVASYRKQRVAPPSEEEGEQIVVSARTIVAQLRAEDTEPEPGELFAQAERLQSEGQLEDAYLLYRLAARRGHAQAALVLGTQADPAFYTADTSVLPEADSQQAYKWYSAAATAGNDEAVERLQQLREHVEQSAAAGDVTAQRPMLQWQ